MEAQFLNRRVRATKDESGGESTDSHSSMKQIPDITAAERTSSEGEEEANSESEPDSHSDVSSSGADLATISFGALAKAQSSLGKRKRSQDEASAELDRTSPTRDIGNPEAEERRAGRNNGQEHARPSKHAPAELSSKTAVSRKREVVPAIKRDVRDPRFEPTSGPVDQERAKKNYDFLNAYRDSEISELKTTLRHTKDPVVKDKLKRALLRMESKKKTQQTKDQEQLVLRVHRAKEKEMIKQGKKPFYLKKGEQKKLALIQRFENMQGKQLDKVIQRRRRKKASKEKRDMPDERRAIDRPAQ
ncbi:MAG: hypothetical protein Q9170_000234 [Blastenia crenularia]